MFTQSRISLEQKVLEMQDSYWHIQVPIPPDTPWCRNIQWKLFLDLFWILFLTNERSCTRLGTKFGVHILYTVWRRVMTYAFNYKLWLCPGTHLFAKLILAKMSIFQLFFLLVPVSTYVNYCVLACDYNMWLGPPLNTKSHVFQSNIV